MHLRDLRIRAMDGAVLVDGALHFDGDDPALAALQPPPGYVVGVLPAGFGGGHAGLLAYDRVERRGDGFHAAPPPRLRIEFGDAVPDLSGLLSQYYLREPARLSIGADQLWVGSFARMDLPPDQGKPGFARGQFAALDLTLVPEEAGLRLAFEAPLRPFTLGDREMASARLVGEVLLPASWCMLRELRNAPRPDPGPAVGDWAPWGPGLGETALAAHGNDYFAGRVDWGQSREHDPSGPWVQTWLGPDRTVARPLARLTGYANGFASGSPPMDGPELVLPFGHGDWARWLERSDEAEVFFRGAGIGHLDGQTGRSVGECGGSMGQEIAALRVRLARSPRELRVTGAAEIVPLPRSEGPRSLGPQVDFDFTIPRGWFLARGLRFPRFWDDWKREFPGEGAW